MEIRQRKFILVLLLLSNFCFSLSSIAQTKDQTTPSDVQQKETTATENFGQNPEIIKLKTELEQAITKSYKDRISTQIEVQAFNVSTQVTLKPVQKHGALGTQKSGALSTSEIPADTNLGQIRLNPIFEKFKNEIKTPETWMSQVQIIKVDIFIGLDEAFDENYKKQFSSWIQRVVKTEFGSIGSSKVFDIAKVKKIEPPKELPTIYEQLSKFQVTLGLVFLSLMLFLLTVFFRLTSSKDTKEKNQTALRIQEMKAAQMTALQNLNKQQLPDTKSKRDFAQKTGTEEPLVLNLQVIAQAFKDLQFKLGFFLETNEFSPSEITESWFAQGWPGRIKFAAFIDSILAYGSLNKSALNKTSPQQILNWFNSEKKSLGNEQRSEQFEAFQEFPNIPIQDRYKILEQAYWDLLSMKMMGSQVLKARFSILQELSSDQIQETLDKQDLKLKTMAILHLPQPKIQKLFSSMDIAEKQKLLDESLKLEIVSSTDVELADETLKYAVQQSQKTSQTSMENGISFKSLIPNLLSSLTVQDEFKMLPSAISKLSDGGLQLKKTFPSLAFLNEWPEESLRIFFEQMEFKYIVTYLMMAPQMQDRILKLVPPKAATIIADELKTPKAHQEAHQKNSSDQELDRNLIFLKTRLYTLINDEVVSLNKIFVNQKISNAFKAAS